MFNKYLYNWNYVDYNIIGFERSHYGHILKPFHMWEKTVCFINTLLLKLLTNIAAMSGPEAYAFERRRKRRLDVDAAVE